MDIFRLFPWNLPGVCTVEVSLKKPLRRRVGWTAFALSLRRKGLVFPRPVIEGVYSGRAKHGVKPWMDLVFHPLEAVPRRGGNMDLLLFQRVSRAVPPGGHIMVSYETEGALHVKTMDLLARGVPPALTPLGSLLFLSGFVLVKDWYLSEGGLEGPRKLWGEKPPDRLWEEKWIRKTGEEIERFLSEKGETLLARMDPVWKVRARKVMKRAGFDSSQGFP